MSKNRKAAPRAATMETIPSIIDGKLPGGTRTSDSSVFQHIDLDVVVVGALPNGKIPKDMLNAALPIEAERQSNANPGDEYTLFVGLRPDQMTRVDRTEAGTGNADDPVRMVISKAIVDTLVDGNYYMEFRIVSNPGGVNYESNISQFIIDRTAPGGDVLPPIRFADDIFRNGITLAQLMDMPGKVLPANIPNYDFQATGDVIHLKMALRNGGPEIDAGQFKVDSDSDRIDITYDRATLELVDGSGAVDFYYQVVDEVGHSSNVSPRTSIRMLIKGAPEDIPAPLVPGFDSDRLVTDPDARPSMLVQIPDYNPPALVGDYFLLHVGDKVYRTEPLKAADVGKDVLVELQVAYLELYPSLARPIETVFDSELWYEVIRDELSSPSRRKLVNFDLSIPGGPDPEPDTPENEALGLPILRGATGGADNIITPPDIELDATVIVPWFNHASPPEGSFVAGDLIQIYLGGERAGSPYLVRTLDVVAEDDLRLPMPSSVMKGHLGEADLSYEVTRTLSSTPRQTVSVTSPDQKVTIQSSAEIPGGGGSLPKVRFVRAAYMEQQGFAYVLNILHMNQDGGAKVRIPEYVNFAVGDVINYVFQGFDRSGAPVEASRFEGEYTLRASDIEPKNDDTVTPPIRRGYAEVIIDRRHLDVFIQGHAELTYTATNRFGSGASETDTVIVDVRGPGTMAERSEKKPRRC